MTTKVKKLTKFRPRIRSRHPSHSILRSQYKKLPLFNFRSLIRLGSTTINNDPKVKVELNSIEAIENSSNKLKMKECFTKGNVQTAKWWKALDVNKMSKSEKENLPYPLIVKSHFGSRNRGNTKVNNLKELEECFNGKTLSNYIIEVFHNYAREYRLHVTKDGCFYACRKVLKKDTPDEHKWYRNDEHCNWIREDGDNIELFDKPVNWDNIIDNCVKALKSIGLDFGACDLRIQSATNNKGQKRTEPHFIVVEINSAPSFGDVTAEKYIEILPKLLKDKWNKIS